MTIIAGVVHDGAVYLGADSAATAAGALTVRRDAKVFGVGAFLIGCAGSFRVAQVVKYALTAPDPTPEVDLHQFMATTFIDHVRLALKLGGCVPSVAVGQEAHTGQFLVGVAGRLFTVDSDYQVGEPADEYAAVGSGAQAAQGAMYATPTLLPQERLTVALAAAEKYTSNVRGPFLHISSGDLVPEPAR